MKKNIYISALAGEHITDYLDTHGFSTVLLDGSASPVYDEVSTHADIHMCRFGLWDDAELFMGSPAALGKSYPQDIIYNAVCTSRYFIHNLKYTDEELLEHAENWHERMHPGKEFRHVSVAQGYTRCSCLPADDDAFITSDRGVASALDRAGADVLLIDKGHILLPGFDFGFIGGCCGNLMIDGRKTILFNGDLTAHPDCKKITAFLKDRDIDIVYFDDVPLTDIGSILSD